MGLTSTPASTAEWQRFLTGFSARRPCAPQWGARLPDRGWHGCEPATETELDAAEQRLGVILPPSLRNFLACSNGWQNLDELYGLCAVTQLRWTSDPEYDLLDLWCSFEEVIEVIHDCLVVLDDGTGGYGLLKPGPGEWRAYSWAAGNGVSPLPFPSFSTLVTALAEGTHHPAGNGRPSS